MFSDLNTFSRLFKLFSHDSGLVKNSYSSNFTNYGSFFDSQIFRNLVKSRTCRVQDEIRAEFKNERRDLSNFTK